ncbi:His-Xaa-Ser system radical SAM maturase HxsB [Candidatus Gracilibacteria bacterium]|nr:His-Xaa-Ser system radical SAM maturase HxsB [Candidatus Gracilibacteria bacterium]
MLSLDTVINSSTDKIGFFRFKKFDDNNYIITNDAGKFQFLSNLEFNDFISGNFDKLSCYGDLEKKGFIKGDSYVDKMIGSVSQKNHFVGVGPTLHMIVVTLRCNHTCKYCHAAVAPMTATEFDMSIETAKKVVDAIFYTNSPSLTIEFQGGEPLVNYDVVQFIVNYAKEKALYLQKDLSMVMVSNLTLMTEDKLIWLLDNGVDICTSLDGDKVTHNSNRIWREGDSFEKVTYWMKRLDEEKQKRNMGRLGALLTVTKETLPKYKEIIDTYVELGLPGIFLRWLNPYGFASAYYDKLSYEDEDWIEFYKKSLDYIIDINKSGKDFKEVITSVYLEKIFKSIDPAFMDIRSPSGIAIGGVAYNYDGKVYASDESRMLGRMGIDNFLMTEVFDDGKETYLNMMNSDIAKTAIVSSTLDGLPGYNDHAYKPYLGVDIIHNFKTRGSLYVPLVNDKKVKLQIAIIDYIFEKLRDPASKEVLMKWIQN